MIDGRFDQHFLELFAQAQAQEPGSANLPAFVLTLVLLVFAVALLLV